MLMFFQKEWHIVFNSSALMMKYRLLIREANRTIKCDASAVKFERLQNWFWGWMVWYIGSDISIYNDFGDETQSAYSLLT